MKKSFNQLKKDLKKGTKVKTIKNIVRPENEGEIREISIVQTNAIAFKRADGRDSWLWWTKAGDYEYEDNTFKVYTPETKLSNGKIIPRELTFIYEIEW